MDKKLVGLIVFFVVVFALFVANVALQDNIKTFTRASTESVPSSELSLIFAWPLTVNLPKENTSKIDVFVRSANTVPIPNKQVVLQTDFGTIDESTKISDKSGKATFILKSDEPGLANLTVLIDNKVRLSNKISIKFEKL